MSSPPRSRYRRAEREAQDGLAACICFLFLRTVRLPSLQLGALILSLMFAYDIFMVFVSPLIFHTSVMMSVATAGEPQAWAAGGVCERTAGERIPMLLLMPRFAPAGGRSSSPQPEYAMLGLG